jgi:chromosome segregation ATPase
MESLVDVKKYIARLVETNRALASDLDASRRVAASLGHQRDAFELESTRLRSELEQSAALGPSSDSVRQQTRQLRAELAEQQRELEQNQARLRRAEERISSLTAALGRAELERDAMRRELEEFKDVMDQIRSSVQGGLEDAIRGAEPRAERWD